MYLRPVHSDLDPEVCHAFVRENPLGLLITHLPSSDASVAPIQASHIPFVIDPPPNGFPSTITPDAAGGSASTSSGISGVKGKLRGHMARANPQVKAILTSASVPVTSAIPPPEGALSGLRSYIFGSGPTSESSDPALPGAQSLPEDVLIIFTSPTNSYVTPTFYTETKPSTHKVVPTWNYAAVQVYGTLKVYDKGPEASAFLQQQVEDLTRLEEGKLRARCPGASGAEGVLGEKAWEVAEAPVSYVELLKKGIVGVEIDIKRIEGKFKMSQESDQGDFEGVVHGFNGLRTEEGRKMADMVEERGKKKGMIMCRKEQEDIHQDGTTHELSKASKEQA